MRLRIVIIVSGLACALWVAPARAQHLVPYDGTPTGQTLVESSDTSFWVSVYPGHAELSVPNVADALPGALDAINLGRAINYVNMQGSFTLGNYGVFADWCEGVTQGALPPIAPFTAQGEGGATIGLNFTPVWNDPPSDQLHWLQLVFTNVPKEYIPSIYSVYEGSDGLNYFIDGYQAQYGDPFFDDGTNRADHTDLEDASYIPPLFTDAASVFYTFMAWYPDSSTINISSSAVAWGYLFTEVR